jgi:PTS system mannose-specific IIC component
VNGLQVALVALVGGLLTLERKSFAQLMLSRPIVATPLIAWLLGDPMVGLQLGVPLELYYLGASSYGVSNPDHEGLAAIFAGAAAASVKAALPAHVALAPAIVFLLALGIAILGKHLETALERWNGGLVERTENAIAHGHLSRATSQLLLGLPGPFLMGAAVAALATLIGPVLAQLQDLLPPVLERGLSLTWLLLVGLSAALAIRSLKTPKALLYSGASALAVAAVYGLALVFSANR